MFDRSVPMIPLAMQAHELKSLPEYELPVRYGWRFFRPGDELIWSRIETSAGEFDCAERGLIAFYRYYPNISELQNRMIFLTDNGVPFATATAWYGDEGNETQGRLHWVSVDEPHQGKGLSNPLVSLAMHQIRALGHTSAYLTTQTASWVAIRVYHKFGFIPHVTGDEEIRGWEIVSRKTGIDFMKYINA